MVEITNVQYTSLNRLMKKQSIEPTVIEEGQGSTRYHFVVECPKSGDKICQFDAIVKTAKKPAKAKNKKFSSSVGGPGTPS